jgi:hypothetical protein
MEDAINRDVAILSESLAEKFDSSAPLHFDIFGSSNVPNNMEPSTLVSVLGFWRLSSTYL